MTLSISRNRETETNSAKAHDGLAHAAKRDLPRQAHKMGVMKKMMLVMAGLAICAATAQASDFETALKNELLANHQRHIPEVSVSGNEVTLTYGPEEQWSKSTAHDEVAKMDALDCLKADYAALKTIPGHHLHDYFHVINYSLWSHQIIGEATVKRSDYPSAKAVDAAMARMLAQWREKALKATP